MRNSSNFGRSSNKVPTENTITRNAQPSGAGMPNMPEMKNIMVRPMANPATVSQPIQR